MGIYPHHENSCPVASSPDEKAVENEIKASMGNLTVTGPPAELAGRFCEKSRVLMAAWYPVEGLMIEEALGIKTDEVGLERPGAKVDAMRFALERRTAVNLMLKI